MIENIKKGIAKNVYLMLIVFFILAIFLRFYNLQNNPPSLTWDEAAWGYNAYSLLTTGKDEFGKSFPITYLESFGDFKPPLYAYLTIIPVAIFGLNEFATRFASAFFGSLTVLMTFFLTREIFSSKPKKEMEVNYIALLATFLLAISPWHILLSRAAFEANVATFFIVLGVLLFLLAMRMSKWLLLISLLSFVLSMYTFNSARIVAPLLAGILVLKNYKELIKHKIISLVSILIAGLVFLPLALFLVTPQAKLRFQEVNIFSDGAVVERINQQVANDNNAWWSKIIHNRRLAYSVEFLRHYFDNLSPRFLFIRGDGNPKFSTQDVGQLYLFEIPTFIIGFFMLFRQKRGNWWIIPVWLFLGIIPAATARETPHALRIEVALPTFQIISATGLITIIQYLLSNKLLFKKLHFGIIGFCVFSLFSLFTIFYFIHTYFTHYAREYSGEWQYGYKEAIEFIKSTEKNYDHVYFTETLGRPYIYVLYYLKTSPEYFQMNSKISREALGFVHVEQVGKFTFAKKISDLNAKNNSLFVDTPQQVPPGARVLKKFYLLNGDEALIAYTK